MHGKHENFRRRNVASALFHTLTCTEWSDGLVVIAAGLWCVTRLLSSFSKLAGSFTCVVQPICPQVGWVSGAVLSDGAL